MNIRITKQFIASWRHSQGMSQVKGGASEKFSAPANVLSGFGRLEINAVEDEQVLSIISAHRKASSYAKFPYLWSQPGLPDERWEDL